MKRLIFGIALILCSITALSQGKEPIYKIAGREISAILYKKNLTANVASYIDNQGWNQQEIAAFKEMYREYVDNLTTGRFSTDEFFTITDNKGVLSDEKIYYYDKDGNLCNEKPRKPWYVSKSRYERKLRTFNPSRKVATYARIIGQALIEELDKQY